MTRRSRKYFNGKTFYKHMAIMTMQPDIDFDDDEEEGYDDDDIICYSCQTCGMDSKDSCECPNCGAYDMEACYF